MIVGQVDHFGPGRAFFGFSLPLSRFFKLNLETVRGGETAMTAQKKSVKPKIPKGKSSNDQDRRTVIELNLFDGTRNPLKAGTEILVRIRNMAQKELVNSFYKVSSIRFEFPFQDNFADNYTVLASASGFRDAGFTPVKTSPELPATLDLMLVPDKADFRFLPWTEFQNRFSDFARFLCCGLSAESRYTSVIDDKPAALASLLNLTAAMSAIHLPAGTPLDYFKSIEWDDTLAQDRFFGFADQALVTQVRTAAAQGLFAPEPHPDLFHGDATSSFKQVAFGEANVQLTFHERTTKNINGVPCVRVEPDIDYYKDLAAHSLLEVIPNTLNHGLTNPKMVYVLRWIAGRHAGVPEFNPGYFLA
jgi:hypothetical protein